MTKATYGSRPQQVIELLTKMGPSTPSFVQQALQLNSTGYVYALLTRMTKQGLLKREGNKYSAIEGAKPKRITVTKRKAKARQGVVVAKPDGETKLSGKSVPFEVHEIVVDQLKSEVFELHAIVRYLESRLGVQN